MNLVNATLKFSHQPAHRLAHEVPVIRWDSAHYGVEVRRTRGEALRPFRARRVSLVREPTAPSSPADWRGSSSDVAQTGGEAARRGFAAPSLL